MTHKKQPQATDIEKAVLGAALIDGSAVGEMIEILRKEKIFFDAKHQAIYDAILELYETNEAIDLLTVSSKLKQKKKLEAVGGDYALIQLTQNISSGAHMDYHCRILQQQFVKRKAIHLANNMQNAAYDDEKDIFDILDSSYRNLDKVSDWLFVKKPTDFKSHVDQIFQRADTQEKGIPSCIQKLQGKLNGYQKSNLIILAARPGMGKTAFIVNEALKSAMQGIPVGIFSLEMSSRELAARMFANYLGISAERISLNKLENHELQQMNEKRDMFEKLPIYIHDQPGISPLELKIQANKWKREKKVEMIFVDYLQLMNAKTKGGNREQEVSLISRSLKGIAKELDIPVMSLSQLSRAVETRGGSKRPLLSDLRDSGSIEQDADLVMFLYRPEYYGVETWDDDDGGPTANQAEILIAKFRNGKTGSCIVGCRLKYMQFHDLEEDFSYPPIKPNDNPWENEETETKKIKVETAADDLPF